MGQSELRDPGSHLKTRLTNELIPMSRIPTHTVEDAPDASRPLLQKIAQSSPKGRPLNVHAQMAHSPAVLAAYTSLRAVTAEHGTLDPKVSWALNLATAATVGNDYMIGLASRFAGMNGWTEAQIAALQAGTTTGDARIDALTRVVREAAANSGKRHRRHVEGRSTNRLER
jgi:hypothetical protein